MNFSSTRITFNTVYSPCGLIGEVYDKVVVTYVGTIVKSVRVTLMPTCVVKLLKSDRHRRVAHNTLKQIQIQIQNLYVSSIHSLRTHAKQPPSSQLDIETKHLEPTYRRTKEHSTLILKFRPVQCSASSLARHHSNYIPFLSQNLIKQCFPFYVYFDITEMFISIMQCI